MMKKQRKKSRGSSKAGLAMDKELKVWQQYVSFRWVLIHILEYAGTGGGKD